MPINKLALIRYKTIDHCLQNRFRKWTLDDLIEACSEAIYEFEGIKNGVSRRTIQLDIQNMRSEKIGYSAPIIVMDKKYYSYENKTYSINNIPLTHQDLSTLNEVLDILNQFKGFSHFQELNAMVTRLEDKIYKQKHKGKSYIDFEKNELLKGLNHIDSLHKSIINRKTLVITYQSFKVIAPQTLIFYPYLLKEYRNRWFVLGGSKNGSPSTLLALDRIISFHETNEKYINSSFDVTQFFSDVIGVSKGLRQKPILVILKISKTNAPYILTKPLHASQQIIKEENDGMTFSIEVLWNFELEREILGFGEEIKVLSPKRLAGKIMARMKKAVASYQEAAE